MEQRRSCLQKHALDLTFKPVLISLQNEHVNIIVAPVYGILDRTHHLFRLGHALEIEISPVILQQF